MIKNLPGNRRRSTGEEAANTARIKSGSVVMYSINVIAEAYKIWGK
jgi:hypothetical protein